METTGTRKTNLLGISIFIPSIVILAVHGYLFFLKYKKLVTFSPIKILTEELTFFLPFLFSIYFYLKKNNNEALARKLFISYIGFGIIILPCTFYIYQFNINLNDLGKEFLYDISFILYIIFALINADNRRALKASIVTFLFSNSLLIFVFYYLTLSGDSESKYFFGAMFPVVQVIVAVVFFILALMIKTFLKKPEK